MTNLYNSATIVLVLAFNKRRIVFLRRLLLFVITSQGEGYLHRLTNKDDLPTRLFRRSIYEVYKIELSGTVLDVIEQY